MATESGLVNITPEVTITEADITSEAIKDELISQVPHDNGRLDKLMKQLKPSAS